MKDSDNKHIDALKEENRKLLNQLEVINEKLKESDAFKGHFISNITNEIVNPFTSILGISKNITQLEGDKIGQIHSMAHLIYNEAFDLDFQLQNIFAAAKIESGEINMELSSVDPVNVTKDVIESLRFKSEKKSQYIELKKAPDLPYNFVTDLDKLQIIIKNIISNAIIFGEEKSKISVDLSSKQDHLCIQVSNIGTPINLEDINRIFDRFTKLDKNINSINQGHGLGLSVSKAYLEFLEGEISVSSSSETGNQFTVSIPPTISDSQMLIRDDDLFIDDSEIF